MASLTTLAQGSHELAVGEGGQGAALAAAVPVEVERGALAGAALPLLPPGWAAHGAVGAPGARGAGRVSPPARPAPRTLRRNRVGAAAIVFSVGVATVPAVHAVADVIARWIA